MSKDKIQNQQLLPEERVRQWFISLLESCGVERYRISTEYPVIISGRRLRVDIAIFGRGTKSITAIVECKAPEVPLTTKVITQAAVYNSIICARYIIATNGKKTFIWDSHTKEFLTELPSNL
ncbi:MAG: type I restriction enzyme HsdR N-terminal domain-containing protein [Rikenellaceae bacterium]